MSAHTPVLRDEVVRLLAPRPGGTYCDATVGLGGHATAILDASAPDGRLIAVDRDPEALEQARALLAPSGRARLVHGTIANLDHILDAPVDGLLVDLGVSSMQLDRPERGFSFTKTGPLDMRMDPTSGETAEDLLRRTDVAELEEILREYGEERYAAKVARAVKQAFRRGAVRTTTDLAQVVVDALPASPRHKERIHPATRTFQALRVAVNRELEELDRFLSLVPALLAPGARCVVIAFHSLEDRRVKERFRELEWTSRLPPDLAAAAGERTQPICKVLTKRPVVASSDEVARNPRARSAKLRACEKETPRG